MSAALQTRGLCKSFGALTVADNINFTLEAGARHALIGPNGAGKTTFVNMLTGRLAPSTGSIFLGDEDVTRLSQEQRRFLIEALRPFAGQKVSIASIRGDDDGEVLAHDFVSVFDAAGWDHHGEAGVTTQDWPRDPVGIEVVLNENDARKDKISDGVAALINTVRQLGMVYDSTIYMDNDVPEGQALLKVGKKLRK